MHSATDGSPLLTESLLRLFRQGVPLRQALDDWAGKAGRDARGAALQKEIDRLTPDSKRCLLGVALLGGCSRAELKILIALGDVALSDCIDELQSLFLIDAPSVTLEEPRFSIPDITRALVLDQASALAMDHKKLQQSASDLRSTSNSKKGNAWIVGAAINQARAQILEGRCESALKTLQAALRTQKGQRDLLSMLGATYMRFDPPKLSPAREAFKESHQKGNRRPELYVDWYRAEVLANSPNVAVEVCNYMLEKDSTSADWLYNRAYARAMTAKYRRDQGDPGEALKIYEAAADDLSDAISNARMVNRPQLVAQARELHDLIIQLAVEVSSDPEGDEFECLVRAVRRGDRRTELFRRMLRVIRTILDRGRIVKMDSPTDKRISVFLQRAANAISARQARTEQERRQKAGLEGEIGALEEMYRMRRV